MATDNEPLSDKRLAALRDDLRKAFDGTPFSYGLTLGEQKMLMREVDRLRAENAAMREIVEAVASSNPYGSWYPATNSPAGVVCRWCMERALSPQACQHDHECTWRQARALLSTQEQGRES